MTICSRHYFKICSSQFSELLYSFCLSISTHSLPKTQTHSAFWVILQHRFMPTGCAVLTVATLTVSIFWWGRRTWESAQKTFFASRSHYLCPRVDFLAACALRAHAQICWALTWYKHRQSTNPKSSQQMSNSGTSLSAFSPLWSAGIKTSIPAGCRSHHYRRHTLGGQYLHCSSPEADLSFWNGLVSPQWTQL